MCMCVTCGSVHRCLQRPEEETVLREVARCMLWVLVTKPQSFVRAAGALHFWAVSPAPLRSDLLFLTLSLPACI